MWGALAITAVASLERGKVVLQKHIHWKNRFWTLVNVTCLTWLIKIIVMCYWTVHIFKCMKSLKYISWFTKNNHLTLLTWVNYTKNVQYTIKPVRMGVYEWIWHTCVNLVRLIYSYITDKYLNRSSRMSMQPVVRAKDCPNSARTHRHTGYRGLHEKVRSSSHSQESYICTIFQQYILLYVYETALISLKIMKRKSHVKLEKEIVHKSASDPVALFTELAEVIFILLLLATNTDSK